MGKAFLFIQHANYANVEGMGEHGYVSMSPIEELLANYLSMGEASTLKAPSTKQLAETELDEGQGLPPEVVMELCHTMGLALSATKQTATEISRSMTAMVATGPTSGRKRKNCLLDVLV